MNTLDLLQVMLFSPAQLAAAICLAVLFALFVAGNIVLFYYLRNRGVRKLCTHQLQDKRNALLEQLEILRAGGFVSVEAGDEEDEDEDILVVDDEDDDEDDESAPQPQNYFGVVDKEEVDETMDAEILTVAKTSAEARAKLGFASSEYDQKRYYVRYSLGFDAKLRLSGDEVKERYQALMNEISQYKGVKVKSSYRQQRIYKGRKTLGLIVFCGKTLCIALALNPAEYENTKYRGIDKSDKKRYQKTPMLIKLTSTRRLEYAKFLLVQLADLNTIVLEEKPEQVVLDVAMQTREQLFVDGKLQIIVLGEVPDSVPAEAEDDEEIDVDETDEDATPETSELTQYNRSYTARVIQADDELKARYSELKNHILEYLGVHNHITWKREAFYTEKRKCVATFAVRGKTLCLFLSVSASRFDGTKYKVEDRTQQVRNAKMPTMFRIKSDRSTKYAKEMLDIVLAENGAVINADYKPVNYRPVYRSTENLIRNGYIRVKTTTVTQSAEESVKYSKARAKVAATTAAPKKTVSSKKKTADKKPTAKAKESE